MYGADTIRRRIAPLAGAVTALVLAVSGCSGSEPSADPEDSPEPTPTAQRWKAGEFTRDLDVCRALSQRTLARLEVEQVTDGSGDPTQECSWGHMNGDGVNTLMLTVRQLRYEPPPPRPNRTASQEAAFEFQRPPRWQYRSESPARGLGDQAKVARRYVPGNVLKAVGAVVRVRNTLFTIEAKSGTTAEERLTDVTEEENRMASFARLEEVAYAAARDLVTKVGGRVGARPAAPAAGKNEVTGVKDVCDTRAVSSRMVEDLEPRKIRQVGKERARTCVWTGEDLTPELSIEVDAIAPSPFTGESAIEVANSIVYDGEPLRKSIPSGKGGLGDGAEFAYDEFDDGKNHEVGLTVRRGNLLLHVEYERWFDPPQGERPAWMKEGVEDIAREVLDDNR